MEKDCKYIIQKDIPLGDGMHIKKGRELFRTHGCYYLDGGLQSPAYQEDFDKLVKYEESHGWNYLAPLKTTNYKEL